MSCGTAQLSEKQAIELAENYVLKQGYTNSDLKIDSTSIQPDFTEQVMTRKGIIKLRYNSLKPQAAFQKKGLTKWTVGFQNTEDSTHFRMVQFSRKGKKIKMVHQSLKLID